MRALVRWSVLVTLVASESAFSQHFLKLKTRRIDTSAGRPVTEINSPRAFLRGHLLLQFGGSVSPDIVAELKRRGIAVLQDVPENGLLVSVDRRVFVRDLGVRYAARIHPADKVSPLIGSSDPDTASGLFLVEFHPDVDLDFARGLVLNSGVELRGNPDLHPHHLMIRADDSSRLSALAMLDEVAYIFPASDNLAKGVPTRACAGAITLNGTTGQFIRTYGDGWDGPGQGAAPLTYVFSQMARQLGAVAAQAEIQRAMAEWSKVVKIQWKPGTDPNGTRTVRILFATGAHGDGYPFDGTGGNAGAHLLSGAAQSRTHRGRHALRQLRALAHWREHRRVQRGAARARTRARPGARGSSERRDVPVLQDGHGPFGLGQKRRSRVICGSGRNTFDSNEWRGADHALNIKGQPSGGRDHGRDNQSVRFGLWRHWHHRRDVVH